MKFYLAPLEGITGFDFRNTVNKYYGKGVDKYFTPFFAPHTKRTMNTREMRDVLAVNNEGINLVPQILTISSADFLRFEHDMHSMGYDEVNINIGCPSGTVTAKGRGSGLLKDKDALDEFLYGVYEKKTGPVSVKTRLGYDDPEEFYEILDIYNRYEMSELIIHPRVRNEFYKGRVHKDIFAYAMNNSRNELCFSGDIFTVSDYEKLMKYLGEKSDMKMLGAVMLGRGMVANPSLIRQLAGGSMTSRTELYDFCRDFASAMLKTTGNPGVVLAKMKELWNFMTALFPGEEKAVKKMLKCKTLDELLLLQKEVFFNGDFLGV